MVDSDSFSIFDLKGLRTEPTREREKDEKVYVMMNRWEGSGIHVNFFIFFFSVFVAVGVWCLLGVTGVGGGDSFARGGALADVDEPASLLGTRRLQLVLIVADGRLNGIFGKHGAM